MVNVTICKSKSEINGMVEMIASAHLIDALLHDVVTKSQGLVGLGVADTLYYIWKWKSWCYVAVVERTNC